MLSTVPFRRRDDTQVTLVAMGAMITEALAAVDQLFPTDRATLRVTILDGRPHTLVFLAGINRVRSTHLGFSRFGQEHLPSCRNHLLHECEIDYMPISLRLHSYHRRGQSIEPSRMIEASKVPTLDQWRPRDPSEESPALPHRRPLLDERTGTFLCVLGGPVGGVLGRRSLPRVIFGDELTIDDARDQSFRCLYRKRGLTADGRGHLQGSCEGVSGRNNPVH